MSREFKPMTVAQAAQQHIPTQLHGRCRVDLCVAKDHTWIRYTEILLDDVSGPPQVYTMGVYNINFGRTDPNDPNTAAHYSGTHMNREIRQQREPVVSTSVVVDNPAIYKRYTYGVMYDNCTTYAAETYRRYSGRGFYYGTLWHDPETLLDSVSNSAMPELEMELERKRYVEYYKYVNNAW